MTDKVLYGLTRDPGGSDPYVDHWKASYDPTDMLKPSADFVALATLTHQEVERVLSKLYPPSGEGSVPKIVYNSYYGTATAKKADVYHLNDFGKGVTAAVLDRLAKTGGPTLFLPESGHGAESVLRDVYLEEAYTTAPVVLKAVTSSLLLATPDAKAAKVRVGRRAAAKVRAENKKAAAEKRAAEEKVRSDKHDRTWRVRYKIECARTNVLNDCELLENAGTLGSLHGPYVATPGGDRDHRTRHPACGLRAAVGVHARLKGRTPWRDLPVIRELAAMVLALAADGLLCHDEFDKTHADDRDDVAWLKREAKRVSALTAAVVAAVSTPPQGEGS